MCSLRNMLVGFAMMITTPVFATGIGATNGSADPATCDTDTLGTATGPANLRAEFTPEVINLRWYDSNTLVNVSSASNTCTYDTAISLPPNPTRPGYKFKGWKVRPEYDFSTLPTTDTGTQAWCISSAGGCLMGHTSSTNMYICDNRWNDLKRQEWKSVFSWGTIYGTSLCSSTSGTNDPEIGNPNLSSSGTYCWCKATGYIPNGNNIRYAPNTDLPWVHVSTGPYSCSSNCADYCSFRTVRNQNNILSVMFGISGS